MSVRSVTLCHHLRIALSSSAIKEGIQKDQHCLGTGARFKQVSELLRHINRIFTRESKTDRFHAITRWVHLRFPPTCENPCCSTLTVRERSPMIRMLMRDNGISRPDSSQASFAWSLICRPGPVILLGHFDFAKVFPLLPGKHIWSRLPLNMCALIAGERPMRYGMPQPRNLMHRSGGEPSGQARSGSSRPKSVRTALPRRSLRKSSATLLR